MNMKSPVIIVLGLAAAAAAWGQGSAASAPATPSAAGAQPPGKFTNEQLTEEFGWWLAKRLALTEVQFTPSERDSLVKGLGAALAGQPAPYDLEKAGPQMNELMNSLQTNALSGMKSRNESEAAEKFAQLKNDKNVTFTPSGLAYEIVTPGSGPYPSATDTVKVNYTGKLLNGQVFDSSAQHGGPAEFALNGVIPGWTEGIQKINKGGKIRLYIPANLAYGENGTQGIPPASALIFDVELLDFKPGSAAPGPGGAAHP